MKKSYLAIAVLAALSIALPAQAKFTAAGVSVDQQIHAKKGGKAKSSKPKSSKTHTA